MQVDPKIKGYAFINSLNQDLTFWEPFADLIVGALSAGNPLRV